MLETISRGFRQARARLAGVAELTPDNIEHALGEVRTSLLEADVEFQVTQKFLARVKEKALGQIVQLRAKAGDRALAVTPEQHFIKICQDELTALLGDGETPIQYAKKGPTTVMLVGLQGSGKTTTIAKLARWFEKQKRRPMLVAADIYRPAAVDQLRVLAERLEVPIFSEPNTAPPTICAHAVKRAFETNRDVVLLDTAGRLAIDDALMQELAEIKAQTQPQEVLFVVDAMAGQDAVRTARTFHEKVGLTGVVLTKLDGDARGGVALSIRDGIGSPIRFLGVGESLEKLEEFRPEGLAGRILGMGDLVGLMKEFEGVVDEEKAEADAARMLQGNFDMQDFLDQVRMIQKMGSMKDLLEKLPFFSGLPDGIQVNDNDLVRIEAMISSMTRDERQRPDRFLTVSWEQMAAGAGQKKKTATFVEDRIRRVARGSGRKDTEVKDLLNRFAMMRQLMSHMGAQTGLLGKVPGFKQISQMRKMAGFDVSELMNMAGLPQAERKFAVPRTSVDRNKEKRKRKEAKKQRKKQKRKK